MAALDSKASVPDASRYKKGKVRDGRALIALIVSYVEAAYEEYAASHEGVSTDAWAVGTQHIATMLSVTAEKFINTMAVESYRELKDIAIDVDAVLHEKAFISDNVHVVWIGLLGAGYFVYGLEFNRNYPGN